MLVSRAARDVIIIIPFQTWDMLLTSSVSLSAVIQTWLTFMLMFLTDEFRHDRSFMESATVHPVSEREQRDGDKIL